MAKIIIDKDNLGTVKICRHEVPVDVFDDYVQMFNSREHEDFVEFITINLNKAEEIAEDGLSEKEEEIENLYYENKKMGNFLELLGFTPDEVFSYVINGNEEDLEQMIIKAKA